jgi:hypothetical protein
VGPGLTVSEEETLGLPTSGGCTEESVGGSCCGGNVEVVPMASTSLNPFGIMGTSTHASSSMPIDAPKVLSWVSPSTWSSVWLLSWWCPMVAVLHIPVPWLRFFFNDILP